LDALDSLARTNSYYNKWIVNRVAKFYLAPWGEGGANWQKNVALKATIIDIDYAARYNSSPAITSLPKDFFANDLIIDRIKEVFRSPYITQEEADIIVQQYRQYVIDTTGYAQLMEKYSTKTLTETGKKRYNNLSWELKNIQATGQTIQEYTDSLNRYLNESRARQLIGRLWEGCYNIISNAGWKHVYPLAPVIESFATPEMREKLGSDARWIDPILARLKYKDYYQQQEEKYTNILDSCILYLRNNPNLDADNVWNTAMTINDCWEKMKYIDVPDIYYRMAPLLTLTNKMKSGGLYSYNDFIISVGGYYLYWGYFTDNIKNMPNPRKDIPSIDWDKKGVPLKMYKWMMENKDNYQLDDDPSNDN